MDFISGVLNIPNVYGQIIYFFLDLLPDLFKIIFMVIATVFYVLAILEKNKEKSEKEALISALWLILGFITIGMVWKAYFNQEVDTTIWIWFINIPFSIYEYLTSHIFVDILGIIVFLGYWVPREEVEIDLHEASKGFSSSEEKAYMEAEHIKKVRRNL